jgi:hypothetical protein
VVSTRDGRSQRGNRQMRLADSVRADQADTFQHIGERVGKAPYGADGVDQFLVRIDLKVVEPAAPIPRGNSCLIEQAARLCVLPALAAHDTAHAVSLYGLPTGVVASRAHGTA